MKKIPSTYGIPTNANELLADKIYESLIDRWPDKITRDDILNIVIAADNIYHGFDDDGTERQ